MKNIKNDLVVVNYLKENNPVQSIKNDLLRYYEEHSCAKHQDTQTYLEENFTIGALLEMVEDLNLEKTEQKDYEELMNMKVKLYDKDNNTMSCNAAKNEQKSKRGINRTFAKSIGEKNIVYDQLKGVDQLRTSDYVFTKNAPSDLNGDDVLAVYTIGAKKDELIDLMYTKIEGKYNNLQKMKGKIVKNYLQCLDTTPSSSISFCKLNNFKKKSHAKPVYNKVTEEIYESVAECAKANNIPIQTLYKQLSTKKGNFEYFV
ncbi:MAG: hypothetical protein IKO56_09535, partial [Alphaproteobacteria bacterium]|nr:hypothetical protein [Alphaproteobacteria bacterium]